MITNTKQTVGIFSLFFFFFEVVFLCTAQAGLDFALLT